MTNILYVRHCESVLNTTRELIGGRSNDSSPTARGLYQAALVGARFRENGQRFDALYSSGAVRADRTAQVISEAAGYDQPIIIDNRLQEVSQGPWEGRLRSDVYTDDMIRTNRLEALDGHLPGAESVRAAQRRMLEFATDAYRKYPDGTVLVVSHGLAIRGLAGAINGLTKQLILDLDTPNVSTSQVHISDHGAFVDYVGKTIITE